MEITALAVALAGLILVVVPVVVGSPMAAYAGLAGHGAGAAVALLVLGDGWYSVATMVAATAGWAVTAVAGERPRGSSVVEVLNRLDVWLGPTDLAPPGTPGVPERVARALPSWLVVTGGAATAGRALVASGAVSWDSAWLPAALAVLGLVYVGVSRLPRIAPHPARALSLGGLALATAGTIAASLVPGPGTVVAGASLAAVVAIRLFPRPVTTAGRRPTVRPRTP